MATHTTTETLAERSFVVRCASSVRRSFGIDANSPWHPVKLAAKQLTDGNHQEYLAEALS